MASTLTQPIDVKLMNGVASALFMACAVLGLVAVAVWGVRHPVWTVHGITVHGDVEHQNVVTFRAHLASRLSGGFLTVDVQEVRRLFEAVPWVRQAVVQRQFPNRLKVTLEEHRPVAWWGESGGGKLVNSHGEVFEANPDDPQADQWSELLGPSGQSQAVYSMYQALLPVFGRMSRELVRLELDGRGSWKATLDNGGRIELGRGDTDMLLSRAQSFAATAVTLSLRYGGRDIESADLRYADGYALRMRGVTTLSDNPPTRTAPRPVPRP
jgi:cell division protein FtsQ